jgi:rhamnose utilization protein RhaD (predicted bifunctional aldolase and dehydrogenase)
VLHGGGNTSVKLREKDVFGLERDVLYVKGSGSDLETISAAGFAPLPLLTCRSCRRCRRCRMRRC